jgi:quercetin dioxygenase-like cupin family protein
MLKVNESEFEYRFGDSGPKYLLRGPRMNFGVVVLQAGQDFRDHLHNIMEENFFILEGELEFIVDGNTLTARAGDLVHVEPGEAHYLKNTSNAPAKAVFALAPFQEKDKVDL